MIRDFVEFIKTSSLRGAIQCQGLRNLYSRLEEIVPDIKFHYSNFVLDSEYLRMKVRGMHSFQIALVKKVMDNMNFNDGSIALADIGDSSGTHILYLKGLYKADTLRFMSVNVDEKAIERIRSKGIEAINGDVQDLKYNSLNADIVLSFQLLEHLSDPLSFLRDVAKLHCKYFIVTVPYLKHSRVGLQHLRNSKRKYTERNTESIHIFELCPDDWRLLFKFAGWDIFYERIYLQYASWFPLLKSFWRMFDYEGFYGVILTPKDS